MSIQLQFLGAAKNVTGSSYLLEVDSSKILIDSCIIVAGSGVFCFSEVTPIFPVNTSCL